MVLDDIKPRDIAVDYSMDLLVLVSAMLSTDRDDRPTASQVKMLLAAIAKELFKTAGEKCGTCQREFISKNALRKHVKKAGHGRNFAPTAQPSHAQASVQDSKTSHRAVENDSQFTIRGVADAPTRYFYDDAELDASGPSICMACNRHFKTKRQLFAHLGAGHHFRSAKYISKRKAEMDATTVDGQEKEGRFIKWMRKDMQHHDRSDHYLSVDSLH